MHTTAPFLVQGGRIMHTRSWGRVTFPASEHILIDCEDQYAITAVQHIQTPHLVPLKDAPRFLDA